MHRVCHSFGFRFLAFFVLVCFGTTDVVQKSGRDLLSPRSTLNTVSSSIQTAPSFPTLSKSHTAAQLKELFNEIEIELQNSSKAKEKTGLLTFDELLEKTFPDQANFFKKLKKPEQAEKLVPAYVPNESYLTLQTSELIQAMAELVANAQDTHSEAFLGEKSRTLGRFGLGALQVFGELLEKDENGKLLEECGQRAVILESKKRGGKTKCTFLFYWHQGAIVFNAQTDLVDVSFPAGTSVTVLRNLSQAQTEERVAFLKKTYHLNTRTPIHLKVNNKPTQFLFDGKEYLFFGESGKPKMGPRMQPISVHVGPSGFSVSDVGMGMEEAFIRKEFLIPKMGTKSAPTHAASEISSPSIYYKLSEESPAKGEVGIWLNERFIISKQKAHAAQALAETHFMFPHYANTTENWLSLALDDAAVSSIKKLMHQLVDPRQEIPHRFLLIQSVVDLIEQLQPNGEHGAEGDLLEYFSKKLNENLPGLIGNRPVFPNKAPWAQLKLPENALFISPKLLPQSGSVFHGMQELSLDEAEGLSAKKGIRIYLAPFLPQARSVAFHGRDEKGKWIILNQEVWEQHKNRPELLKKRLSYFEWPEEKKVQKTTQAKTKQSAISKSKKWFLSALLVLMLTFSFAPNLSTLKAWLPQLPQISWQQPENDQTYEVFFRQNSRDVNTFFRKYEFEKSGWNGKRNFYETVVDDSEKDKTERIPVLRVQGDTDKIEEHMNSFIVESFDYQDADGMGRRSANLQKRAEIAKKTGTLQIRTVEAVSVEAGQPIALLTPYNGILTQLTLTDKNGTVSQINLAKVEGKFLTEKREVTLNQSGQFHLAWKADLFSFSDVEWIGAHLALPENEKSDFKRIYASRFQAQIGKSLSDLRSAPEDERFEAVKKLLKENFVYDLAADYEFDGKSWFSTFESLWSQSPDGKAHVVCNGTARFFQNSAKALGLEAIYHAAENLEDNAFYADKPGHAYVSVKRDGWWGWAETTKMVPSIPRNGEIRLWGNPSIFIFILKFFFGVVFTVFGVALGVLIVGLSTLSALIYLIVIIAIGVTLAANGLLDVTLQLALGVALGVALRALGVLDSVRVIAALFAVLKSPHTLFRMCFNFKKALFSKSAPFLYEQNLFVVNKPDRSLPRGIFLNGQQIAALPAVSSVAKIKYFKGEYYLLTEPATFFSRLVSKAEYNGFYKIDKTGKFSDNGLYGDFVSNVRFDESGEVLFFTYFKKVLLGWQPIAYRWKGEKEGAYLLPRVRRLTSCSVISDEEGGAYFFFGEPVKKGQKNEITFISPDGADQIIKEDIEDIEELRQRKLELKTRERIENFKKKNEEEPQIQIRLKAWDEIMNSKDDFGNNFIINIMPDGKLRFSWNGQPYSFVDLEVDIAANKKRYKEVETFFTHGYFKDYPQLKELLPYQLKSIQNWSPFHLITALKMNRRALSPQHLSGFEERLRGRQCTTDLYESYRIAGELLIARVKDPVVVFNRLASFPVELGDEMLTRQLQENYLLALADPSKIELFSEEAQIYVYLLSGKEEYVLHKEEEFKGLPELQKILLSEPMLEKGIQKQISLAEVTRAIDGKNRSLEGEKKRLSKTVTNQDKKGRLHLRELLQNARDAALEKMRRVKSNEKPRVDVRSYLRESDAGLEWIVSVADSVGMAEDDVEKYLLNPDATTKSITKDLLSSDGFLGQGFFTVFNDASEVRVRTGKNGNVVEVCLAPQLDEAGNIVDILILSKKVFKGEYEGTLIQKVHKICDKETAKNKNFFSMTRSEAILEHAHTWNLLKKYVGAVQDVQISWNGTRMNESITVLAEEKGIELFDGSYKLGRITLNHLYVQSMEDIYLAHPDIPTWLKKRVSELKLNLNFPKGTLPIRSRTALQNPKQYQERIRNLLFQWTLKGYREGTLEIPGLPKYAEWLKQPHLCQLEEVNADLMPLLQFKLNPQTDSLWEEFKKNQERQIENEPTDPNLSYSKEPILKAFAWTLKRLYQQTLAQDETGKKLFLRLGASDLEQRLALFQQFVQNGEIPREWIEELIQIFAQGEAAEAKYLDRLLASPSFWENLRQEARAQLGDVTETQFNNLREKLKQSGQRHVMLQFQYADRFPNLFPPLQKLISNKSFEINRLKKTFSQLNPQQRHTTLQWYLSQLEAVKGSSLDIDLSHQVEVAL